MTLGVGVDKTTMTNNSETYGSPLKLEALHVQSRSFWAPANIGPYSQAISVPSRKGSNDRSVYIAGQIPLIPATMLLPLSQPSEFIKSRDINDY